MFRPTEPGCDYITRGVATYPTQLNRLLAMLWVNAAAMARSEHTQAQTMVRTGKWANTQVSRRLHSSDTSGLGKDGPGLLDEHITDIPKVTQTLPLRGSKRPQDLGRYMIKTQLLVD